MVSHPISVRGTFCSVGVDHILSTATFCTPILLSLPHTHWQEGRCNAFGLVLYLIFSSTSVTVTSPFTLHSLNFYSSMGSWMKRIKLLLLVFPPRASSQLFLPPSSNLLPVIEPLSDPFVDVFEFGGVDQDHVDQDQVDQDHVDQDHVDQVHVDQDHVDQDHVDKGLLGDEPSISFPTTTLNEYRCVPDQFCFTFLNKTRSVMGTINSSPNLTLLSRALALTALTPNLTEVHCTWVWNSLLICNVCPLFQAKTKVLLLFQADPLTVFAPSNAAFARANADGWVGDLASLRHLLLRHVVRCRDQIRDKKDVVIYALCAMYAL